MTDARAAVAAAAGAFGGLDVLVNRVGIFDFYRGLSDIDDDQLDAAFDEIFAVNVKSHLVSVRAALPELRASGGSVVLTPTSKPFSARFSIIAIIRPNANPIAANRSPCPMIIDNTCLRVAPSATRTPISCVLCATEYEMTPYSPIAAKTKANAAKAPSSIM